MRTTARAPRIGIFFSVILRSPTRQSLRRSGYGPPAKAESRYGDGARKAPKNLLPDDPDRSFAKPVLSGEAVVDDRSRSFAALRMTGESEGLRMTSGQGTEN